MAKNQVLPTLQHWLSGWRLCEFATCFGTAWWFLAHLTPLLLVAYPTLQLTNARAKDVLLYMLDGGYLNPNQTASMSMEVCGVCGRAL
jgi:hypothetical protein